MSFQCGKCKVGQYRLGRVSMTGGHFAYMAAVCGSCGDVAGLVDMDHLPTMVHEQNAAINKIARALGVAGVDLPER